MSRSDSEGESDTIRLQKVLARAGLGSRRACEALILAGRVRVDGKAADQLGTRVNPATQDIVVDGERITTERAEYYLLNKPRGYLCTNHDPRGRPRVIDLFPGVTTRLFTVGRLDEHSQGLLMVTNDGELAHQLIHPRYQVPRFYRVQVAGVPNRDGLKALRDGLKFSDGYFRVHTARKLQTKGKSTFLLLELRQGRNREIRRMMARIGHKVISLERTAFGPLQLGRLKIGQHRRLRPGELDSLRELIGGEASTQSDRKKSRRRSGKVVDRKRRGGHRSQRRR
jgi:23S rRNA pseudouridine2605 synthase